jgi:hypothetical protein
MTRHTRLAFSTAGLAALVAVVGCQTTTKTPVPEPSVATTEKQAPGHVERQNVIKVSAVVEDIDHDTRMVTLRRSDHSLITFRADDSVRNLDQVQRGDVVAATYYESVAVDLHKPGEATPGVSAAGIAGRAPVGDTPRAAGARSITMVATIRALDPENGTATLEDDKGNISTIEVRNPQHFEVARVGDLVEITYTEAVAISVDKP